MWIFGECAPSRRNKKTLCGEHGLSMNTKEPRYLMNETWKEKNKLGLKKKKWWSDYVGLLAIVRRMMGNCHGVQVQE